MGKRFSRVNLLKSVIQENLTPPSHENNSLVMVEENVIKYMSLGSTEGQINSHWTSHYNGAPAAINSGQGN